MNVKVLLRSMLLSVVLLFSITLASYATHLRAGEIIVERVSCNSLVFDITVTVFTNTINTNVLFGGEDDWLDFGDGQRMLIPETVNTPRPDLGEGIATASFTVRHVYSGYQQYTVSYSEPNRNEGVVNMDGSVNTRFYIETSIIVDPFLGCNNTPKLLIPPIDRACVGVAWFHNPGAYDPDGDSLSYELVIPFREKDTQVINYKSPADPKFYASFNTGNEEGIGPPSFSINATDGTITWDAPGMQGEYNIAFVVKEWRIINGRWYNTGFVRRDMQIIVDDCDNERPDLIVPEDVCVEAGTVLDANIFGIDPDGDDVKIEAFSEIFNFAPARFPATYTPNPPIFQSSKPRATLKFQWKTDCAHVKEQPYQVVFKITDKTANSRLVTFKTWFIKVVGPAPKWVNATVNVANRTADIKWESYFCQNAETIQVWRRVDSFAFEPDSCQTGMPDYLGYSLIATLPVKNPFGVPTTTYKDTNEGKGLNPGAGYCYRLVAIYPRPRSGESYVSKEICIDPILVDEPVITNVSIDKTGTTDGEVFVRWTRPFEINKTQFPGPYFYEVYRADGFAGNANLRQAHTGLLSDTTFTDKGLNTRDVIYNYRVVLYSNTALTPNEYFPVDTSSTASTVRLSAKSEFKKIILDWAAFVPWSNLIQTEPNEHDLYRGSPADGESGLQLIAKIDPTTNGFIYVDEGQHNGVPLQDTQEYCYRVMTRGSYGNPGIKAPLENFSQMICAQPNDSIPPCQPQLEVQVTDCDKYLESDATCELSSFSNTLTWRRPEDDCAGDIQGYKVYRGATADGDFDWMSEAGENGIVRDTFFVDDGINHAGLGTLAYCYKISAIDRSNNESELSEPACNDNCPYYELPNVFTPGVGDDCNRFFSAFSNKDRYIIRPILDPENPEYYCGGVSDPSKCARFVERVNFKVFNRWGKEIYEYVGTRADDLNSIYIDWDGRAKDGSDLAAGIYYYVAEVTFDSSDPDKRNKTIKGWVHLIR